MYKVRFKKYGNKITEFNGRRYDSKFEAGVARDLELLTKSGEVIAVEPQKTFPLRALNGTKICNHRPDFLVTFKDGHQEIWEAKGYFTEISQYKVKMFVDNYPDIPYLVIKQDSSEYYKSKNK